MASAKVKEISVFVDESGSFAADEESSRFYLICLVLHDQDADISAWVKNLEDYLASSEICGEICGDTPCQVPEKQGVLRGWSWQCSASGDYRYENVTKK